MSEQILVRRAEIVDLSYIDALRRKESEAIGFLPWGCYEGIVTGEGIFAQPRHRIWIAEVNGDPVGFCYASPGRRSGLLRVVQVCVQEDARRLEYGAALVSEAERYADQLDRAGVGLHVASDLEASAFWQALGYDLVRTLPGGVRRRRTLEDRAKLFDLPLFGGRRWSTTSNEKTGALA